MDPRSLTKDFKEFLQCLNEQGVEYLLIGGHRGRNGLKRGRAAAIFRAASGKQHSILVQMTFHLSAVVAIPWLCLTASAAVVSPASFTLRADWFDRGNVRVSEPGQDYADRYACIWNSGQQPNQAEYDVEFPVTADYTLVALYTAAEPRPVDVYLDGARILGGFGASDRHVADLRSALGAARHAARDSWPAHRAPALPRTLHAAHLRLALRVSCSFP